jgi:PAS domain S-box-containing protein
LILRLEFLEPPAPPVERDDVVRLPDVGAGSSTTQATPPALTQRALGVAPASPLTGSMSLNRWSAAVAAAHDGCFVLDVDGKVLSVSVAGVELLGSGDGTIIGRHILEVVNLVDLETGAINPEYAPRITPLVALESPGLARSLMRVRHDDGSVVTLDTSSAPIHDAAGNLLGSMTFLAPIAAR